MPITTPETELQFQRYSAALELKEAAKTSIKAFENIHLKSGDFDDATTLDINTTIHKLRDLLSRAEFLINENRPDSIESRGYKAVDRGLDGFAACGPCSCDGGDCSSGGSCGGCKP